ncbi:MAG TPA: hypothetical protein VIM89_21970 [Mucilaginibacter sp.]
MNRAFLIYFLACVLIAGSAKSQTLFVDAVKGNDDAKGTVAEPLRSLERAATVASTFTGNEPVTIKLAPGLYLLAHQVIIPSFKKQTDTIKYTIEAMVMPDDDDWSPAKMPVIQSVSANNKDYGHFNHCVGFQIERNNVSLKGLKFLGNASPDVEYYYPVERHNPELQNLEISQCYFIGEKNSSPIQGCVFAQGSGIHVDHCIFFGCKNAILVFIKINDFSLANSIIYGTYEGAVWFGYNESADLPFTFRDNIISNSNYFFVGYKGVHTNYVFNNSLIANNTHYMVFNGNSISPDSLNKPKENGIRKTGTVILNEVTANGVPKNYLNLSASSAGNDIPAGIFKKQHHE